ncbi:hypothetical protein [Cryptosporangium arvum]|uniref:hypothetical protein n=1 Tax=Cryptosporangium arvum TaxID=80871 RepID=UPI0012ED727C|nr:hypothetical protein [Cryptosporangium arvum]
MVTVDTARILTLTSIDVRSQRKACSLRRGSNAEVEEVVVVSSNDPSSSHTRHAIRG